MFELKHSHLFKVAGKILFDNYCGLFKIRYANSRYANRNLLLKIVHQNHQLVSN
jgi:hypothetical protein